MLFKLSNLLVAQRCCLKFEIQGIGNVSDHISKLKHAHTLLQLLIELIVALNCREFTLDAQVNLTLNQFVVHVLVSDIEQDVVELQEELFALLLKGKVVLLLCVDSALAVLQALFKSLDLGLHRHILIALLMYLCL